MVAKCVTTDSPDRVLAFYRKPLSRYGEVLECSQDKPVGSLSVTRSGLTCSGQKERELSVSEHEGSTSGHELRAGTPYKFRIVSIDETHPQSTHFWLLYIELPKDSDTAEMQK